MPAGGAKLIVFHLKLPFGCFNPANFSSYLNCTAHTRFNYLGSKISLILAFGVDQFHLNAELWVEKVSIGKHRRDNMRAQFLHAKAVLQCFQNAPL